VATALTARRRCDHPAVPNFASHAQHDQDPHRFGVWDCGDPDGQTLAEELGAFVRDLYVEPKRLREILERSASDLEPTVASQRVSEAIDQSVAATVPEAGVHSEPQLDMARNELAELLAYKALPDLYGIVVPARRIPHKDVPQLPVRGLDLLGVVVSPELSIVLCEAKASTAAASPPGVVGDGDSSLRAQLLAFLEDREKIMRELTWVTRHAPTEAQETAGGQAMLAFAANVLPVIFVPLLLRPVNKHGADDFGVFTDDPDQFAPAKVWFCLLRVDEALETLAKKVYEVAAA
jgi:hypothetical protein